MFPIFFSSRELVPSQREYLRHHPWIESFLPTLLVALLAVLIPLVLLVIAKIQPFLPFTTRYDSLSQVPSCEHSRLFLRRHSCSPICSPVFVITKSTKLLLIVSPLLDPFMISAMFCSRVHDCHGWRF